MDNQTAWSHGLKQAKTGQEIAQDKALPHASENEKTKKAAVHTAQLPNSHKSGKAEATAANEPKTHAPTLAPDGSPTDADQKSEQMAFLSPNATNSSTARGSAVPLSPDRVLTKAEQKLIQVKPASHIESDAERRVCSEIRRNWNSNEMKIANILLEGDAGSGKTELVKSLSADLVVPYTKITCFADMDKSDVIGSILPVLPEDGNSADEISYRFYPSEIVRAYENGWLLEIQEPTVIRDAAVLMAISSALEHDGSINLPTRIVHRHPDFIAVITTNRGYNGCRPLNEALRDRVQHTEKMDLPPKELMIERAISKTGCADIGVLSVLADVVIRLDKTAKANAVKGVAGMRSFLFWADAVKNGANLLESMYHKVIYKITTDPAEIAILEQALEAKGLLDELRHRELKRTQAKMNEPEQPDDSNELELVSEDGQWSENDKAQAGDNALRLRRPEQSKSRAEQSKSRPEQSKSRPEQSKNRAEQSKSRSEQSNNRSEQGKDSSEQGKNRAEQSKSRSEQSNNRSEQSKDSSEQSKNCFEQGKSRSDSAPDSTAKKTRASENFEDGAPICHEVEERPTGQQKQAFRRKLNADARESVKGTLHEKIKLIVHRPIPTDENRAAYRAQRAELMPVIRELIQKAAPLLEQEQSSDFASSQFYGTKFCASNVSKSDFRYFARKRHPHENPSLAVALRIDESASMSAFGRLDAARRAAIALYEFCHSCGIPIMICGDSADRSPLEQMSLYSYVDFGSKDPDERYSLSSIRGRSNNRDGMAIRIIADRLASAPERTKLFISISDGQPKALPNYTGELAVADMKQTLHEYRRKDMLFLAAAIGQDKEIIGDIYGKENTLDITDLRQLPARLVGIITRYL